jgi:hypothetical protein
MNIKFICKKHQRQLEEKPELAFSAWIKLISLARQQLHDQKWEKAVLSYGNAHDIAAIILNHKAQAEAINGYIRTAIEFIYALRQDQNTHHDINDITRHIKKNLTEKLYPANIELLFKPVSDMAHTPLHHIHQWIHTLFIVDDIDSIKYH